ncbi:MAG: TetR/AcrR family transcriptional regulator [Actinobacteria bacterium]|nr:TetR/AcrR family transcriptional regulator [Actinomycetota bacterium]
MNTVSPKRAQTRDRLLDAAVALFAEKGVLGASVEEICERAGFTRGAFYSNFASKDELVLAAVERKGTEIYRSATVAVDSVPEARIEPGSVDTVIRQAMLVFQASQALDPTWLLARSEMRLYALRNPSVREPLQAVEQRVNDLLIAAIEAVIARQGATLAVPTRELVRVLEGYYEALATEALVSGRDLNGPEWAERLADLVRALVRFEPGH